MKYPPVLKNAVDLWLYIGTTLVFHETQISHWRIKLAHKEAVKIISKVQKTDLDFEFGGVKYTKQLKELIDHPDEYPSVHMTRLQQYIHELIRVIGRRVDDKALDSDNPSYYKKISMEMKR